MKLYDNPPRPKWKEILRRPTMAQQELDSIINEIAQKIQQSGDDALIAYTERFDDVQLKSLHVGSDELKRLATQVKPELKSAIEIAKRNIEKFHSAQQISEAVVETMPGVKCWRKSLPVEKVGLYIPGGTAPLFSTVLMLAIPAKVAGCQQIVLCTPPDRNGDIHPTIAYAALASGINEVISVGGAQAILAMAMGTNTIPKVDKIFGPGNQYVTAAKQFVQRMGMAIDMPAGPSEVMVVADESANSRFVAIDLLSQAEHGPDSQVILITVDHGIVERVKHEVIALLSNLPRRDIAEKALEKSVFVYFDDRQNAIDMMNDYAAEHLILSVREPELWAAEVKHAGSVFLGHFTPESVGDYASGTNHTLPTNGYARMYSGVSLDSFVKKTTFQQLTAEGLKKLGPIVEQMASAEQLEAHRLAVSIRLKSI